MKRVVLIGVLCVAAASAVSCRRGAESPCCPHSGKPVAETLTIAMIPKSTGGEFWETVEKGARRAAADLGVELKFEGTVTETEIAGQNKIIENMINLGVDGIALAALNKKAQKKLVGYAVDAGIPVVAFDSAVDGEAHSSFVATDNAEGGAMAAARMLEKLSGRDGKVMVMRYVQGTASTEDRAEGFIQAATAGGLAIVADPYPETGTIEGAKTVAVNTLEGMIKDGQLDLDGLFACNLYSTLGVLSALDDLNKSGISSDLVFIGFDTSKKLVEAVQSGTIDSLVAQNPEKMGYLAAETIVKVVKGEAVDALIDTGAELVTLDRIRNEAAIRKLVGLE